MSPKFFLSCFIPRSPFARSSFRLSLCPRHVPRRVSVCVCVACRGCHATQKAARRVEKVSLLLLFGLDRIRCFWLALRQLVDAIIGGGGPCMPVRPFSRRPYVGAKGLLIWFLSQAKRVIFGFQVTVFHSRFFLCFRIR